VLTQNDARSEWVGMARTLKTGNNGVCMYVHSKYCAVVIILGKTPHTHKQKIAHKNRTRSHTNTHRLSGDTYIHTLTDGKLREKLKMIIKVEYTRLAGQ
jgi:hypothetical protein